MDYLKEVQAEEETSETKTNKIFWFIFFGIVFLIIFLVVYFIFTGGNKNISENKLMEGVAVEVGDSDTIKFNFEEEEHGMKIKFTGDGSVELTISSEPIILTLKANETKEVDLNNDGFFDIKIKLVSIVNGKATIAIQKIYEEACQEKWKCYNWGDCDDGIQKRNCKDLNSCGTIFDKPSVSRECLEIEFIENNSAFENITDNSMNNSFNNSLSVNLTNNKSNISLTHNLTNNTNPTNLPNYTSVTNLTNITNTTINNLTNNTNTTTVNSSNLTNTDIFNSKEEFCLAKGYIYFIGNETHICNVQIHFIFNGTKIPCCEGIEIKSNINLTNGLSNQI